MPHIQRYLLRFFVPLSERLLKHPRNTVLHMPYLRTGIRHISADTLSTLFPNRSSMTTASRQYRESRTTTNHSPLKTLLTKNIPMIMKNESNCVSIREKPFWRLSDCGLISKTSPEFPWIKR